MSAFITEFAARRIYVAAVGAGYIQLAAAFVAKLGLRRVIKLTFGALHFSVSIRRRNL